MDMKAKLILHRTKKMIGLSFLLLLLFSSCINHKRTTMIKQDDRKATEFNIDNPRETAYKIQTGDQLFIKVHSLDPKTSRFFQSDLPNLMNDNYLYLNSYTVDDEGFISFSFIDKVHVQGKTTQEAQKKVQETINEYFNEVNVVLKLINFQVSVMGEVDKPGTYTINREYANVLQAISLAGGANDIADIKQVKLIRQTPSGSIVKIIDMSELNLLSNENYHLMPNDILYLDPRPIKSFRYGEFPYSLLLSIASTGMLVYTIFFN